MKQTVGSMRITLYHRTITSTWLSWSVAALVLVTSCFSGVKAIAFSDAFKWWSLILGAAVVWLVVLSRRRVPIVGGASVVLFVLGTVPAGCLWPEYARLCCAVLLGVILIVLASRRPPVKPSVVS